MLDRRRAYVSVWLVLSTVIMHSISSNALAEEIGTTPEGNVIYRFSCVRPHLDVTWKYDWENHVGKHPEWDYETGGGLPEPVIEVKPGHISRSGQVLRCRFKITMSTFPRGDITYRYKVRRDIVSCQDGGTSVMTCVLRPDGGGQSSSSATSASQPPPGSISRAPSGVAVDCCTMVANSVAKGRFGRIVVTFPPDANPTGTRTAALKDGKEVQAGYGSQSFQLLSGTYQLNISGKMIPNVTVQAGHDTNVKVGVLRITGGKNMRAAVLEGGQEVAGGYGGELIGLPAGAFDVQMAGQTEKVMISEGKITDF